ncbi:hypothetical protein CE91St32_18070 [Gordonibacter pamelaeae]|uniref:TetR/AcrR family transcriptional regulator n=1 Tax=Gordonibacter TaxID=644652 RepID=UPI0012AFDF4F|nr:TetR/AcrR family transcriptional regulator [Gordonibacter pamelaeae]MCQ4847743.1 TetR/AcrR family transcriptional regulator [Gordonibacter pamelaeae]MCQ4851076.1 TetR/AcrR family transcriptional regulator [Gordonibacter pamelaeae]MSA61996.1 TetR family transcriptional regulator [Gordonibacter pamelaeae]GKG90764.1 hypothetical protein CE91St32_18070 [Gordonibacter pamelaeae]
MDSGSRASAARRAIVEAYIDLMEEKPYDSIRVKELVQRSNVARSTFYVHFRDAIDVLEGIEGTLLGLLSLYRSDGDAYKGAIAGMPFECMENWFEVCIEHERVLRALTGPHGDPYFTVRLQNQIRQELNQMMDDDRAPRDRLRPYYVELLTASYIGLMSYIVKEKNKSEYLEAHELASIANSTRAAYYKLSDKAPRLSDERLFGAKGLGEDDGKGDGAMLGSAAR